MASYNPPNIYFNNIHFNEYNFIEQKPNISLERVMSVLQNLNKMGMTDSNTNLYISQPIITDNSNVIQMREL